MEKLLNILPMKRMVSARLDDEEFMFKFINGVEFVLISLGFTLSVLLFTFLLIKIDLIFFVANGYPGAAEFQDAYMDFVYSALIDEIPLVILIMIFIFILGFYLSSILIRPFKQISQTCEQRTQNINAYYIPEFFSDLKLLTSFTVFFFSKVDESKNRGKLEKIEIPQEFMSIHKPVFETNFFLNYLFIVVIFALLASVGILVVNNHIREQIFILTQKFLHGHIVSGKGIHYFLEEQYSVADVAVYFFISMHLLMYCLFGIHLFGKISGPSFAVFATMRSFLKGNQHSRIHLIGYYYLRNDCRKINKYLDHLEKTFSDQKDQT